jgi:hypothetical protein
MLVHLVVQRPVRIEDNVVQHNGVSLSRTIALQGLKIDITGMVFGYRKIKSTLQIKGAITFLVNASSTTLCSQQYASFFLPIDMRKHLLINFAPRSRSIGFDADPQTSLEDPLTQSASIVTAIL